MPELVGMLIFTIGTQLLGAGLAYNDDVANEIARQKGICDAIDATNDQIGKISTLLADVVAAKTVSAQNDELISQLSDTLSATIKNINDLKKQFYQKLLIMLVTNIVIVAVISIYIINKTT